MTSELGKQTIAIQILPNISRRESNDTMKFGQLIENITRETFLLKSHAQNVVDKLFSGPFLKKTNYVSGSIVWSFIVSQGSSQIYNKSARHERHERHECGTSETRAALVRHECYMNDTSATRVKNFGFDNDTSKDIFSYPSIYYTASERLLEEEQFHSNNYLLEMPLFHAKMRLRSAPQKLKFLMVKAISKCCTLDCSCNYPCAFPHSYAQ